MGGLRLVQARLTVDFDGFRLAALLAMQLLVCGVVTGFRLRQMLPTKLRTPAAVGLLAAAALGLELFVGNLNWLATHGYTPIDLRPYLTADARPHRADRTERREHNTAIHRLGFPDL